MGARLACLALLSGCVSGGLAPPAFETGIRPDAKPPDTGRDSGSALGLVGTTYFPLDLDWRWFYGATDGGTEARQTMGKVQFQNTSALAVHSWQTAGSDTASSPLDLSTNYYSADSTGVSLLGEEKPDNSDPTVTDTLTYDPPLLFVPADPGATPTFSTVGTVRLVVTDSSGAVVQDTTIDWSMAGSAMQSTISTPAGSFDGYVITYTPGGALGFAANVGMVDMGGGRLLQGYGHP